MWTLRAHPCYFQKQLTPSRLDEVLQRDFGSHLVVHIDDDSIIYDVTLNQSDSGANANKFYRMQVCKSTSNGLWYTWTRWGKFLVKTVD